MALPYFDVELVCEDPEMAQSVEAAEKASLQFIQDRACAGDINCFFVETVHATTGLSLSAKFLQSLHKILQVTKPNLFYYRSFLRKVL